MSKTSIRPMIEVAHFCKPLLIFCGYSKFISLYEMRFFFFIACFHGLMLYVSAYFYLACHYVGNEALFQFLKISNFFLLGSDNVVNL